MRVVDGARLALLLLTIVSALGALAACGQEGSSSRVSRPLALDEQAGTFRGVSIGDGGASVRRALGAPAASNELPEAEDLGVPGIGPPASASSLREGRARVMVYGRTAFYVLKGVGVYAIVVAEPDAKTDSGLRVGSPLSEVRSTYRTRSCGTQEVGEGAGAVPYCTTRVGRNRYLWFGGDPVKSITLNVSRMAGPDF